MEEAVSAFSVFWNPPTQTFELGDPKTLTTQPGTLKAQDQSFVKPDFLSLLNNPVPAFQSAQHVS
jgi:hypothetical protein